MGKSIVYIRFGTPCSLRLPLWVYIYHAHSCTDLHWTPASFPVQSFNLLFIDHLPRESCLLHNWLLNFLGTWGGEGMRVLVIQMKKLSPERVSECAPVCCWHRAELGSGDSPWFYQPSASQIVVGSACFFAFIVNLPFVRHFCKTQ